MPALSAHALRTAVVGAATSDPAFAKALVADPSAAVTSRFGVQPYDIQYIVEKENEVSVLIPTKTEQLEKVMARTVADIGDRQPTRGQFHALVVQKAWADAAFLDRLKGNPRATIDAELKAYGTSLPASSTPKVYVEKPQQCVIVAAQPADESGTEELSDAELEAVAGGETVAITIAGSVAGAVVGAIVGEIVGEWICS
jgi:hypothetical protein